MCLSGVSCDSDYNPDEKHPAVSTLQESSILRKVTKVCFVKLPMLADNRVSYRLAHNDGVLTMASIGAIDRARAEFEMVIVELF